MTPREETTALLKRYGAVLKRDRKHEVYMFPDGTRFTRSKTPGDWRADNNSLAMLNRLIKRKSIQVLQPPADAVDAPQIKERQFFPGIQLPPEMPEPPEPEPQTEPEPATPAPVPDPASGGRRLERYAITPAQAKSWLDLNVDNRRIADRLVGQYAEDMKSGRWEYNYQAIIFSITNRLLDGQHRLHAIVRSNTTIEADVVFDAPDEVRNTIDIGKARTTCDLAMMEQLKNPALVAAVARHLLNLYRNDGVLSRNDSFLTKSAIMSYLHEHLDEINSAVKHSHGWHSGLCSPSLMVTAHVWFRRQDQEKAGEFMDKLASGIGLERRSPILRMREVLLRNRDSRAKLRQEVLWEYMKKAWKMHLEARECRALKLDRSV